MIIQFYKNKKKNNKNNQKIVDLRIILQEDSHKTQTNKKKHHQVYPKIRNKHKNCNYLMIIDRQYFQKMISQKKQTQYSIKIMVLKKKRETLKI